MNIETREELNSYLRLYFDLFKPIKVYSWIGGGSIRDFILGEKNKDIDFYFKDNIDKEKALVLLKSLGYKLINSYKFHHTLQKNDLIIDISHREKNPTDCILNFDYTICACAIDSNFKYYFTKIF